MDAEWTLHRVAVGSKRNEAFIRGLGADAFVDDTARPFEDAVRNMDVVFDTVGGETFKRAFATLRKGGFLVTVVAFPGDEPSARNLIEITRLVEAGAVVPHVEAVLPFAQIKEALAKSETGRAPGKIVLSMED